MQLSDLYKECSLCPNVCGIDRRYETGFCGAGSDALISSYMLHFGEEPSISFKNGSGTIFFAGCSLKCPFCQNKQISHNLINAVKYDADALINIIGILIDKNADNINFVTPDHFLPHIAESVMYFKKRNINIPFIYNCSGFQSIENLKIAADYIDIFLIDYKFADKEASINCIGNELYPEIAAEALDFLFKKSGNLKLDKYGKAVKGVLVRHLIMPDFIENSIKVINNLFFDYGNEVFFSLMSQYSPAYLTDGLNRISRKVTFEEYNCLRELIDRLSFKNGYIQDFLVCDDGYSPDFDTPYVFEAQNEK